MHSKKVPLTHPTPCQLVCACCCAGKPSLRALLADDPYFDLRQEPGHVQSVVKLRISRLAKLINSPELIAEYRAPAGGGAGGGGAGASR